MLHILALNKCKINNPIYSKIGTFLIIFFILISLNMRAVGKKVQQSISNFIEKTYNILQNQQNSEVVGWTPRGLSFIIKDIKKFEEQILPVYFKHSNFSSFVRQLNMYSFHKVRGDKLDCEFEHEKFKKGHRDLLSKIKRKQSESCIMSHHAIEQPLGVQSVHQSSQNIKNNSQIAINSDLQEKESAKPDNFEKIENSLEQLQILRRENRALRAIKQNKLQKHKLLSSSSPSTIGQKFFKLTTCLLAQKVRKQLKIQDKLTEEIDGLENKNFSFDQIIQHIINSSYSSLEFYKYSSTAKTISSQQSDFDFMVGKANNNLLNSIGPLQTNNHNEKVSQQL